MSRNTLQNGFLVVAAVSAGAAGYNATKSSSSPKARVAETQQRIIRQAQQNSAHPVRVNYETGQGSMAAYEAPIIAQEAKAVREAKELTAKRIAKLSFTKAYNQATDVGLLISDISDRTSIPAKEVLDITLSKSSVTALEARNVHFIYNSNECNSFTEGQGKDLVGYVPLTFSDSPENTYARTVVVNTGMESHDGYVTLKSDENFQEWVEHPVHLDK
jgi:hypothetical protein